MADNAAEELDIYINKLSLWTRFYVPQMWAGWIVLILLRFAIFVLPLATAVIAAMTKGKGPDVPTSLIVLPIINAALVALLSQLRLDNLIGLFEECRQFYDQLADECRLRRNSGAEQPQAIHKDALNRVNEFQKAQPAKLRAAIGAFFASFSKT